METAEEVQADQPDDLPDYSTNDIVYPNGPRTKSLRAISGTRFIFWYFIFFIRPEFLCGLLL